MEDGVVTVSRAAGTMKFPAQFLLAAAMNPCPCGNLGSQKKPCTCLPGQVTRYQKRISGPIVDRIDIHLSVPEVEVEKLGQDYLSESSQLIQKRVQKARDRQRDRFKKLKLKKIANAELSTRQVKQGCPLSSECQKLLNQAANTMNLSARSYFRMIKVARTISDLDGEANLTPQALAEALQYRPKED